MKKFEVYYEKWVNPSDNCAEEKEVIEADGFEVADGALIFYKTLSGEEYDEVAVCHEVNVCAFKDWNKVKEVKS